MKKIPTLFERTFENHKIIAINDKITDGCDWVMQGLGVATVKFDGSCTAIMNGEFYKRFDGKKGRKIPDNAIPCCEPDAITGHHPHWVKLDRNNPADKWFWVAYDNTPKHELYDGTYEAVGVHFNGNNHNLNDDKLIRHGIEIIEVGRSFEEIKEYLRNNEIEGIVFWLDGEPMCKIKRSDFGFKWGKL